MHIVSHVLCTSLLRAACLASLLFAAISTRADAQSAPDDPASHPAHQWFEVSAGADSTSTSWSTYSSITAALAGDIRENGYRLRLAGGAGRYRYTRSFFDEDRHRHLWPEFFGDRSSFDILVGYHWTIGPATLKAYAGLTEEHYRLSPGPDSPLGADDENVVQGARRGTKLVLETWTRLGDWGFLQVDANWSEPFKAYGGRVRLGYALNNGWSTGLETGAFGNIDHDGGRAGGFARYEWQSGEVSLSGGFDGDLERIGSGYISVAVTARF